MTKKTFKAWNSYEEMTFEYNRSFEMFGFTWAIHRPRFFGIIYNTSWRVSEITTGLSVQSFKGVIDFRNMKEAESDIKKFLKAKGEDTIKKVVAKGRRRMTVLRKKARSRGMRSLRTGPMTPEQAHMQAAKNIAELVARRS